MKVPAWLWPGPSGPAVATLFQRLLALIFLVAWISLATQVRLLIGARGLMPLESLLDAFGSERLPWYAFPTLLRWPALAGDGVLLGGTLVGAALMVAALLGLRPRLCFGISTVLYLSYTVACREFLAFQWDNLLLECGVLAVFLDARRPAPIAHLVLRLLCFKLYFESGIAKWQSSLRDWHDGSAMTFYYETAPLPAGLGWFAHNLPAWWHHFESRLTLVLELVVPFGFFGPRRVRVGALAALTAFQIVNALTANYGFFCYLAVALHLFVLDDAVVERLAARLPRRDGPIAWPWRLPWPNRVRALAGRYLPPAGLAVWVLLSALSAAVHFTEGGPWLVTLQPLRERIEPLRLVNSYHLFASITRERIEPQFEIDTGQGWRPLHMWHKPGALRRRPDYVAPHQPRVDFLLWFHGLSFRNRRPLYVTMLLERLCTDPAAVAPLFRESPEGARAVRIAYHQYWFTTRAERRASGEYWKSQLVDVTAPIPCDR